MPGLTLNMLPIHIYTDGAAKGNPGPGGFGIVMIAGPYRKEYAEGYRLTTNNRMELMAVIRALEMLKTNQHPVIVFSDSQYVVKAIEEKWVFGWAKKNFAGKKNADLWTQFLRLYPKFRLKFVWVKGHADNKENNRCDELAVAAASGQMLKTDHYFEANRTLADE